MGKIDAEEAFYLTLLVNLLAGGWFAYRANKVGQEFLFGWALAGVVAFRVINWIVGFVMFVQEAPADPQVQSALAMIIPLVVSIAIAESFINEPKVVTKKCPSCGFENAENETKCVACGAELPESDVEKAFRILNQREEK